MNKQTIIEALHTFIRQRPGLDYGNYQDPTAYRAEVRSITKDLQHARTLLQAITWRDGITAEAIVEASKHAFSGRLEINPEPDTETHEHILSYTVGQYFPTEYRKAVAAVCASCLWQYWRINSDGTSASAADIRRIATRELGRGIAQRWFR